MRFVLAEADVLLRAFTRRDPDLLLVHLVTTLVRERRLAIQHWVRQALLARTRDARQFLRLEHALAAFPAPRIAADDYVAAARLAQRLSEQGQPITRLQSLSWAVADRLDAEIWAHEKPWPAFASQGCPMYAP